MLIVCFFFELVLLLSVCVLFQVPFLFGFGSFIQKKKVMKQLKCFFNKNAVKQLLQQWKLRSKCLLWDFKKQTNRCREVLSILTKSSWCSWTEEASIFLSNGFELFIISIISLCHIREEPVMKDYPDQRYPSPQPSV